LQEWADREGHSLELFEDIAVSGQSANRTGFEKLMDCLDSFDAVVVRELSRFGRSLQQVLNDMDQLEDQGVEFISLRDNIDTTTAQGKLFFNIKTAFNQYWSDLAREHANEMIQRRRERDEPIGRPKKLPQDERAMVRELHDAGLGYRAISNLSKVDNRFSEAISPSTVQRYCKG